MFLKTIVHLLPPQNVLLLVEFLVTVQLLETSIQSEIDTPDTDIENKLSEETHERNNSYKNSQKNDSSLETEHEEGLITMLKNPEGPKRHKHSGISDKNHEAGFDLTVAEIEKFKIWKNGIVPYYIDKVSFTDKSIRDFIRNHLRYVESITGVKFAELPSPPSKNDDRWVFFINRRGLLGCADHTVKNFTNRGVQPVLLGYNCMFTKGEVEEAVMSILGIPAQHNAPDRDKHIKINLENLMPDKKHLFEKLHDNEWLFHDVPYDFHSITHYDMHAFSINGLSTIEIINNSDEWNPANSLSETDILKIKMLYNFISRNEKLPSPECHKLFRPRSKFLKRINFRQPIKPREKPSKYTGIQDDKNKLNENTVDSTAENMQNSMNTDAKDSDIEKQHREGGPLKQEPKQKTLKNVVSHSKQDNLPIFSKELLNYALPHKHDPLADLSDYHSSEENSKKIKHMKIVKLKTLQMNKINLDSHSYYY